MNSKTVRWTVLEEGTLCPERPLGGRGRTPTPPGSPRKGAGRRAKLAVSRGIAPYALTYLFNYLLESLSFLDRQFAALLPLFFCEIGCFIIVYYYYYYFVFL